MAKTKRIFLGHNLYRDEPVMGFDSARGNGRGGQDRDEYDDDYDETVNTSPADDSDPDDEREFEHYLGSVLSDALRAWRDRGSDGANRELGQSARDRRRARDADLPDHRQDFDPTPMTERERAMVRARDEQEILGQVPARSTMTLRDNRTADSRLGFDDARVRRAIKKADVLTELDELFGLKGNG